MTNNNKQERKQKNTTQAEDLTQKDQTKEYDLNNMQDQFEIFRDNLNDDQLKTFISNHIRKIISESSLSDYCIIFLIDKYNSISGFHSDKIYKSISENNKNKDILMFIESGGGEIEPAYLISKTCKRLSKNKFVISIPRRAKSAATLISLGANEIHMGVLSELGPIDPQFNGWPALGLANAVEKIAAMTEKFPKSSDMFAKYLTENLNMRALGYYERVNESATQYAARLLKDKKLPNQQTIEGLADHFTNHYKDHGFVIDSDEAANLLGSEIIKENSDEYYIGNKIYEFLHIIDILFQIFREKRVRFVGNVSNGLDIIDKPRDKGYGEI